MRGLRPLLMNKKAWEGFASSPQTLFCPDHKTPGQKKQNFEIKPVDLT